MRQRKSFCYLFPIHYFNHFIKIMWTWVHEYLFCNKNVQCKCPWDTSKNGLKYIQCNFLPYFSTHFLWDWNENWPFPILWWSLSFPDLLAHWVQHINSIIFQNFKEFGQKSITSTSFTNYQGFGSLPSYLRNVTFKKDMHDIYTHI